MSEPMVSLVLLLSMNEADWKTTQSKRKLPKPKIDPTILQVARVVFEKRLEAYKTSTEVSLFQPCIPSAFYSFYCRMMKHS